MIVAHSLQDMSFLQLQQFHITMLLPPVLLLFSLSSWRSLHRLFLFILLALLGVFLQGRLTPWLLSSNIALADMFERSGIVLILLGLAIGIYSLRAQMAEKKLLSPYGQVVGLVGSGRNMTRYKQDEERLRQLCQAVETMQLGVTVTDLKGKIIYTNPAEARMHGYTVQELLGKDLGVFAPVGFRRPMSIEQINSMKNLRESVNIRKDGSIFPVRLLSDVLRDSSGHPMAIVTTCEDISEYKRTAEKLRQRTRELAILNYLSDALQACEQEEETYTVIVDVCKKLFPAEAGCLCIQNPTTSAMNVVAYWGENVQETSLNLRQASNSESLSALCPHQRHADHIECLSVPIVASEEILGLLSLCLTQESDNGRKSSQRDVDAKRIVLNRVSKHYALALTNLRLREKLRIESIQDSLTGLYNRRYMEASLKREAFRARRHGWQVGIIMLDVDDFKSFNDLYGHKVGDVVLQELGKFLHSRIRGEDIACRYGGEEFLLILPEASVETAQQRAEELRAEVSALTITAQGQHFHVNISLGVASFPNHHTDIMQTVHAADMALYQAKAQGKNRVVVASTATEPTTPERQLRFA